MKIKAEGDFGLYEADAGLVALVQHLFRDSTDDEVRKMVEARAGHEAPWPRPVLEIMWAEWEMPAWRLNTEDDLGDSRVQGDRWS